MGGSGVRAVKIENLKSSQPIVVAASRKETDTTRWRSWGQTLPVLGH
jgi:hypothetical protein